MGYLLPRLLMLGTLLAALLGLGCATEDETSKKSGAATPACGDKAPAKALLHAGHGGPEYEVPTEYRQSNPLENTPEVFHRGHELYLQHCASCHGKSGEGGTDRAMQPLPPELRVGGHTSSYLFWRISEGGTAPFCSSMPAFTEQLDEQERWCVVTYVKDMAHQGH